MKLKEWYEHWTSAPLAVLATATNGLSPGKDKLLAVSIDLAGNQKVLFCKATIEELQKSQQYHKIDTQCMDHAIPKEKVGEKLSKLVNAGTVFLTYNVPFQTSFLETVVPNFEDMRMYDLTTIDKATKNQHKFGEDDLASFSSFYSACMQAYNYVPINRELYNHGITRESPAGTLPVLHMTSSLQQIASSVFSRDILELEH